MVRQRSAKPRTSVQFRPPPPSLNSTFDYDKHEIYSCSHVTHTFNWDIKLQNFVLNPKGEDLIAQVKPPSEMYDGCFDENGNWKDLKATYEYPQ